MSGTLLVDGRPAAGQVVLAVSPAPGRLLASSVTDSEGRFELPDGLADDAWVVVRVAEPVVGVVAVRRSELPERIDVDTTGFHGLTGRIELPDPAPPAVNVFLDPAAVEGVPSELADFFKQRSQGVFDAHFAEVTATGDSFSLRVARGVYRIGGGYLNLDRPMLTEPTVENVVVDRVERAGAGPLPGDQYRGFEVEVDGDVELVLALRTVGVDEL
jgi:hypothetical protein